MNSMLTSPFAPGVGRLLDIQQNRSVPRMMRGPGICAFCEKPWNAASRIWTKSSDRKALEKIAVDHFVHRVLEVDVNGTGENDGGLRQLIESIILCDDCVTEFVCSEERILKARQKYVASMTGLKDFNEILDNPWLDVKRLARFSLKSQLADLNDKHSVINKFQSETEGHSNTTGGPVTRMSELASSLSAVADIQVSSAEHLLLTSTSYSVVETSLSANSGSQSISFITVDESSKSCESDSSSKTPQQPVHANASPNFEREEAIAEIEEGIISVERAYNISPVVSLDALALPYSVCQTSTSLPNEHVSSIAIDAGTVVAVPFIDEQNLTGNSNAFTDVTFFDSRLDDSESNRHENEEGTPQAGASGLSTAEHDVNNSEERQTEYSSDKRVEPQRTPTKSDRSNLSNTGSEGNGKGVGASTNGLVSNSGEGNPQGRSTPLPASTCKGQGTPSRSKRALPSSSESESDDETVTRQSSNTSPTKPSDSTITEGRANRRTPKLPSPESQSDDKTITPAANKKSSSNLTKTKSGNNTTTESQKLKISSFKRPRIQMTSVPLREAQTNPALKGNLGRLSVKKSVGSPVPSNSEGNLMNKWKQALSAATKRSGTKQNTVSVDPKPVGKKQPSKGKVGRKIGNRFLPDDSSSDDSDFNADDVDDESDDSN